MAQTKFDNITKMFDGQVEAIEHKINMIEGQLDIIENQGNFAGKAYYEELMKHAEEQAKELEKQYNEMIWARDDAVIKGQIAKDSEAYADMTAEINGIEEAFQEAKNSALEFKNEMWEMDWSAFEWGMEQIEGLINESQFLRDLWSSNENDLFIKETGRFSDLGLSSGALHAQDYNIYMAQADEYRRKVEEINKELANDPNNKILIDKKNEYLDAQRESILAAQDEKNEIKDLYEEQYSRMLDVLDELIDKRKELLEAEKDLYDYEKDVAEQVKDITDLRKQLIALEGDDSEEAKSQKQQLEDSLAKAEEELYETEYDKWISDQEQMMDKFRDEAERVFNERLDKIDLLLQEMIDYGNSNSESINQTIQSTTADVGYKVTEGMDKIWNNADSGIGKIMTMYSADFNKQLTTVNEYLRFIYKKMGGVVKEEVDITKPTEKPNPNPAQPPKPAPQPAPKPPKPKPTIHIGGRINAGGATIYGDSYGNGAGRQYFGYDPIYTVVGENNGFVLARWHGQSSGYAGWFRKGDVTPLNTGGYTGNQEGIAMLHKKERVLNATQTRAFEQLVYNFLPRISSEISKLEKISNMPAQSKIYSGSKIENTIDLTLTLPNVTNSNEFIKTLQTDKNVQKVIQSFTIDEALGKNSLRKYRVK